MGTIVGILWRPSKTRGKGVCTQVSDSGFPFGTKAGAALPRFAPPEKTAACIAPTALASCTYLIHGLPGWAKFCRAFCAGGLRDWAPAAIWESSLGLRNIDRRDILTGL
jgi:hypothetical protein